MEFIKVNLDEEELDKLENGETVETVGIRGNPVAIEREES